MPFLKLLSQTIFQQYAGQLWEIDAIVQLVIILTLAELFSWSLLVDPYLRVEGFWAGWSCSAGAAGAKIQML